MKRQYRVILLLSMGIFCFSLPPSLLAQNYCSLSVRVLAPNGKPFPVFVTVYENSGRKIEKEQSPPKDVRFCDLGILPVKVVVGTKGCHEITVDGVRNYWQEPYTLKVTYDPEHCMRETLPPPKPFCEVLFRVSGPHGHWIDKATLRFERPSLQPRQTDSAGRALLTVGLDDNIRGSVSAPGYVSKDFEIGCKAPDQYEHLMNLAKE